MFKGFYIIWPGDLVFNWVKVILAILKIEDLTQGSFLWSLA